MESINQLIDNNGKFNLNIGYKLISNSNADDVLSLIMQQIDHIKSYRITQSKRKNYLVASHKKGFNRNEYEARKTDKEKRFCKEEWVCKHCMGRTFTAVGTIMDYQVPLKHERTVETLGLGKIDLLVQKNNDGYLLEVKVATSTEHPLKAIMEIYTYWKQLGGTNCQEFLNRSELKNATNLKKGIVLYEGSRIHNKLLKSYSKLQPLMQQLGVEFFLATPDDEDEILIKDIVSCKL